MTALGLATVVDYDGHGLVRRDGLNVRVLRAVVLGNTCNGCEYGDLSGKLPQIPAMASFEDYSAKDTHIEPITTYKTMSIVVHGCNAGGCSPRVACGDIEYHPY